MLKVLCRKQVHREVSSSMIRAAPEKAWDPGSTLDIHLTVTGVSEEASWKRCPRVRA